MKRKWISVVRVCMCVVPVAAALCGCGSSATDSVWQQLKEEKIENDALAAQVKTLTAQNGQLARQVQTLQGIDNEQRCREIDSLVRIDISKRSGLYDKNNDGVKETLVVYVEPVDSAQDRVKAAGQAHIELWNLDSANPQGAMLAQWDIAAADVRTLWADTVMVRGYRFRFPIDKILKGQEKDLVVKVRFVDYVIGKTLDAQYSIGGFNP